MTNEQSLAILRERRGTMYDPAVVDAFIADYERIMPVSGVIPHPASRAIGDARALEREERAHEHAIPQAAAVTDGLLAVTSLSRALTGEARVADVGFADVDDAAAGAAGERWRFRARRARRMIAVRYAGGSTRRSCAARARRAAPVVAGWVAVNRQVRPERGSRRSISAARRGLEPALRSCLAMPLVEGDASSPCWRSIQRGSARVSAETTAPAGAARAAPGLA
jgi:hypothetical protein